MSKKRKTPFPINDDVDRAQLQVHRAICKLVVIAGGHGAEDYANKAAEALCNLGAQAALPLASVIEQIPSPKRRRQMVIQFREIPPHLGPDVWLILRRIAKTDPSEEVRAAAEETSGILRQRSHERFKRLTELAVLWNNPPAKASGAATG